MCDPPELDTSEKNTIRFLHNISNEPTIPPILKSYYCMKYRLLQEKHKLNLGTSEHKNRDRCTRCCLRFAQLPASYSVRPQTKPSLFARKLLKKNRAAVDGRHLRVLTNYQRRYLKRIGKLCDGNSLVIVCTVCKKRVIVPMTKSKSKKHVLEVIKSSRKRKVQDRTCGLKLDASMVAKRKKRVSVVVAPATNRNHVVTAAPVGQKRDFVEKRAKTKRNNITPNKNLVALTPLRRNNNERNHYSPLRQNQTNKPLKQNRFSGKIIDLTGDTPTPNKKKKNHRKCLRKQQLRMQKNRKKLTPLLNMPDINNKKKTNQSRLLNNFMAFIKK